MSERPLPTEIAARKRKRVYFIYGLVVLFAVMTLLSLFVLPRLNGFAADVAKGAGKPVPGAVQLLASLSGFFKVMWVTLTVGCVALVALTHLGMLDPFLPLLSLICMLVAAGLIILTGYAYYLPAMSLLQVHGP